MNLKGLALVKAVMVFESIGFMEWHARVLLELGQTPQSIGDLSRKTDLFHYHIRSVVDDLVGLNLVEYTRKGIQLVSDWDMLLQLVECCEGEWENPLFDYDAAYQVVIPSVVALKKR